MAERATAPSTLERTQDAPCTYLGIFITVDQVEKAALATSAAGCDGETV